jgi:hypothetical protein
VTLSFGHCGGGTALSFTPGNIDGERVEQKYCETCRGVYCRPAVEFKKGAPAGLCGRCLRAANARRTQEARELETARQPLERPAGGWAQQTKMMPQ